MKQAYVSTSAAAKYLGLRRETIVKYIRRGLIRATQLQQAHYSDERLRRTTRAKWRVEVKSLLALVKAGYAQGPSVMPRGLKRKFRVPLS